MYLPFSYKAIAVFAFVIVHCEAFITVDRLKAPLSSMTTTTTTTTTATARTTMSTDVAFNRLQIMYAFIPAMTFSEENETTVLITPATSKTPKDEQGITTSLVEDENEKEETNSPVDDIAWQTYRTIMAEIVIHIRRGKNFNEDNFLKCRTYLLSRERYISSVPGVEVVRVGSSKTQTNLTDCSTLNRSMGDNHDNKIKSALRSSIKNQADFFRQHCNFTSDEFEFVTRTLVKLGDMCAKNQSKNINNKNDNKIDHRLPVTVAWYKLKEMGSIPHENSMSTYMYILSCSHGNIGNNNDESDDDQLATIVDDALLEVVTHHDILYQKNEKTLTIRMKSLLDRGRIDEAEEIVAASFDNSSSSSSSTSKELEEEKIAECYNSNNQIGRLRTYMPLMEYYCKLGDLNSIIRLYRNMQDSAGVHWDVKSYTVLLSSLARFGYFFADNDHQKSDDEEYGPNLFDTLVSDMANNILELTEATFLDLTEAFRIGHRDHLNLMFIKSNDNSNKNNSFDTDVVMDRVEIPAENGTCPITGVKLRLLSIDDTQRQHVHDTLLEMARTSTEVFIDINTERQRNRIEKNAKCNINKEEAATGIVSESKEIKKESYGYQELLKFSKWLDDWQGDVFTTIIDGANVGYYGHNRIHYSSIRKVVEKLESKGERPLVVMPEKYTQSSFQASKFYQKLSEKDLEVIEWLREKKIMYTVPRLVLDDYFWMLASVSNQTNASQRGDLNIPTGDDQGRFPGMRPMLVTNDKMRDHKLDLLEPRGFRRWCSCHIVNYDIASFKNDEWEEDRKISFVPADSFSCEIQVNADKKGKGNVWHFPIEGSSDWLCIWIKR